MNERKKMSLNPEPLEVVDQEARDVWTRIWPRGKTRTPEEQAALRAEVEQASRERNEQRRALNNPDGNVVVQATRYSVCAMPLDNPEAHSFTITVEWRGGDRWAVCWIDKCLSASGSWTHERLPSGRSEEFKRRHRFDLETALALARKVAPTLVVNGRTTSSVLKWQAQNVSE